MPRAFPVSDVIPCREPLATQALAEALAQRGLPPAEAASLAPPLAACAPYHGLLVAAHLAYEHHYPLTLSPDAIWLTIAQGLARHIDAHAEELRERLVGHAGQIALEVRQDEFVPGDPGNDWPAAIAAITEQLTEHLGGRRDLLLCDFSTTGPVERAASGVVLLSGVRKYFTYTVSTLCGIPAIALEGTPADWRDVLARARAMAELAPGWWLDALLPVLARFVDAAEGRVDPAFWTRLYKVGRGSGDDTISGWINAFFPYVGDEPTAEGRNPSLGASGEEGGEPSREGPRLSDFPSGLSRAPFTWRLLTGDRPMQLVAGLLGVAQDPATLALRPQAAWAVAPDQGPRRFGVRPALWSSGREGERLPRVWPRDGEIPSLEPLAEDTADLPDFELALWQCSALTALDGAGAANLARLWASECPALATLRGLEQASNLREVRLDECPNLRDASALGALESLERLTIEGCGALEDLPALARALKRLPKLRTVSVSHPDFYRFYRDA